MLKKCYLNESVRFVPRSVTFESSRRCEQSISYHYHSQLRLYPYTLIIN